MISVRWLAGLGVGAIAAAAFAVPALQAQENGGSAKLLKRESLSLRGGIGSFTPAAADPRLAAALARSGLSGTGFRFTPAESKTGPSRSVTVAIRARSSRSTVEPERLAAASPAPTLAPIAYNLGVAVGWKRFAITGDVARVDLAGLPGSRETAEVGVTYTGKRLSGRVQAGADRPLPNSPRLVSEDPSYSIDAGASYSLTRNLDVTAGVRYKRDAERDRLPRLTDDRRDSQAVYVGTAFRF